MKRTVLVVDDEPRYLTLYAETLSKAGVQVLCAPTVEAAYETIRREQPAMVVTDMRLPEKTGLDLLKRARAQGVSAPFLIVTAFADVHDAVTALKLGAVDYLTKPVNLDELIACVREALGIDDGEVEGPPPGAFGDLVVASPAMRAVIRDAWKIAPSESTVLIMGESGTGKDLLARFIHRNSPRAEGPFIAVNCAALPATLLMSELFGHERGAFTGATTARPGKLRGANGGILFLDEIGDMPLETQPVLLRALEQRKVTPLGGVGEIPVDFRLLAATNQPLEQRVEDGRFRRDLFYRLSVISLTMLPLRCRRQDILPLARRFLSAGGDRKRISLSAARLLESYTWPGNVRELRNAIERARLLSRSSVILPEALPANIREQASQAEAESPSEPEQEPPIRTLREEEIVQLRRALAYTNGNRTKAAELLGITRRGLLKKMKRFGLE